MATVANPASFVFISVLISICLSLLPDCAAQASFDYNTIYQFGDSMSDTGNYANQIPWGVSAFSRPPYGETYFKKPTGRASDGRVGVDFLAQALRLPLLDPYVKNDTSNFDHGVNFAVGGATALDTDFLNQYNNITLPFTNSSLGTQLDCFFTHLDSVCSNKIECDAKMKKALFVVGEIGLNDYSSGLDYGRTVDEVRPLVPLVIQTITSGVKKLIDRGATRIVVPGNFPMGCFPVYLTVYQTNDSSHYDNTKCLKRFNELSRYHNRYLQASLTMLRKENPGVVILYADYYSAFISIVRDFEVLGLEEESVLKVCCGVGGDYNFGLMKTCGDEGVSSCLDPSKHISWDGVHLTESAHELMTKWLLKYNLASLGIDTV